MTRTDNNTAAQNTMTARAAVEQSRDAYGRLMANMFAQATDEDREAVRTLNSELARGNWSPRNQRIFRDALNTLNVLENING